MTGNKNPQRSMFWTPLKRWVTCISAVNLLFLGSWYTMFPGTDLWLSLGITVTYPALLTIWTVSLVLGTTVWWLLQKVPAGGLRQGILLAGGGFILLVDAPFMWKLISALASKPALVVRNALGGYGILLVLVPVLGTLLLGIWRHSRWLAMGMATFFLVSAPAAPFFTWQILRTVNINGSSPAISNQVSRQLGPGRGPKVLWIIFDEMDYQFAFPSRPPDVELPNFDRFARDFDFYSHAWPTAGETYRAIPSLLTGQAWRGATPGADQAVMLTDPVSGRVVPWRTVGNIFNTFGARGLQSSYIQWHHVLREAFVGRHAGLRVYHQGPYPDWPASQNAYRSPSGVLRRLGLDVLQSLKQWRRLGHPSSQAAIQHHVQMLNLEFQEVKRTLAERKTDFVFAHLATPHAPAIWNSKTDQFLRSARPDISNLSNMELADTLLGELRAQLEAQGDWEGTMVIITSDHWQRAGLGENVPNIQGKYDHPDGYRVPLLIKWPHQKKPHRHDEPVWTLYLRSAIEQTCFGPHPGEPVPLGPPPDTQTLMDLLRYNRPAPMN